MSLDKAIRHGKEHRKPYHKPKSVDRAYRNHGSCPWCSRGRRFFDRKARARVEVEE